MSLPAGLRSVQEGIIRACDTVDRDPAEVTLVAVSKGQPAEAIRRLYDLGQRHFGESRLQEAIPKLRSLPTDIVWHFIGALQSNKAKQIGNEFKVVHTICKPSQLMEIRKCAAPVDVLIEVNIANEPQKSGILLNMLDGCHQTVIQSPMTRFRGLMTVGPYLASLEETRSYFRLLKQESQRLGSDWLSMGMSRDYEVAIQEGATHVRVGSLIFGSRD